ncbi:MAG TPA: ABC transporter substrate-binding protein [Burkholderiaceae bacterium]|nr:ABC transporter substrate-binding protein [Burkholderiaceae bacterium]
MTDIGTRPGALPAQSALFRRGRRLLLGLLVAGAAPLASAQAFEKPDDGVYKDRIDWGVIMDLSGPTTASQLPWVAGFQDHMRMVNDAGGINGRKINVLAEDDRYDAQRHRIAYEKLSDQTPALGMSGLGNSSAQVALMPAIRKGKVPILGTYTSTKAGLDPVNPMFYAGFCGFKEMAQVGTGFFADHFKVKAPKMAVVHLEIASGKEYFDHIAEAMARHGGTVKALPMKVTAVDATPQVLEIANMKADFVAVQGAPSHAILLMRAMQQYGLQIPTFGGTYQGAPLVYEAIGPEASKNFYFMSCLSPAGSDDAPALKKMAEVADKYGHSKEKFDVNYVGGWVVAQTVAEAIARLGAEPTRAKLVDSLAKGFTVDTKGISAPLAYTPTDHSGRMALRPYQYDHGTKQFKAFGSYADYQKYLK